MTDSLTLITAHYGLTNSSDQATLEIKNTSSVDTTAIARNKGLSKYTIIIVYATGFQKTEISKPPLSASPAYQEVSATFYPSN